MQKMLVAKQRTQIVEACSPIQDMLTTACRRPCGMQERSSVLASKVTATGAFGLSAGVAMDLRLDGIWARG